MNQSGNNCYYKYGHSCPEDFIAHMINDIGLTPDQKMICVSIMHHRGNDQFHADRLNIPEGSVRYNFPLLKEKHLAELFRLAIIGYQVEKAESEETREKRAQFLSDLEEKYCKN